MTERQAEVLPEVEEALATLREAYRRALPDKLHALERALRLARDAQTREALEQLYREAHRLFGSAGAYGLADLAASLGRMESALYSVVEQGQAPDDAWWRALEADHAEAMARGRERAR